jgi:cytidylate kinase
VSGARVIAVDGPSGSGKSTLARGLALRLGLPHVNTGEMYRAVAASAIDHGVARSDGAALAAIARGLTFTLTHGDPDHLDVDGLPPAALTTLEVESSVSIVASHPEVREVLRAEQRRIGEASGAVMEGRDIGSVVFPDARLKLYLDAGLATRASRRAGERDADTVETAEAIEDRDALDARTTPLEPAPGAIVLATAGRSIVETLELALEIVGREAPELLR